MATSCDDGVFGLSLGDYQAVLALHKSGRVEVLANEAGERETPMIATHKDDSILVGSAAKGALYRNTHCTAVAMPSLLATNLDSEAGKRLVEFLNVQVVKKQDKLYYEFERSSSTSAKPHHVAIEDSLHSVLEQLAATARLCDAPSPIPCVVSIPAGYSSHQTQLLKQCVEDSGFNVICTAVSPALALLPYGLDKDTYSGHVLVFDMGTRSLSLTVLHCVEGLINVVATETTEGVGGVYLDRALLGIIKEECKRKFYKDISDNKRAEMKLLAAAETAKHSLSIQQTAAISIESLHDGMDFQCSVTRGRFEGVCQPIFQSCQEPIQGVLRSANLASSDIGKVVLVGGVCKIPRLQKVLQELFPSSEILSSVPSDHVVAMGAALQGFYHLTYLASPAVTSLPAAVPCTASDIWIHCTNCIDPVGVVIMKRHTPLPDLKSISINIKPENPQETVSILIKEDDTELAPTIAKLDLPSFECNIIKLNVQLIWNCNDGIPCDPVLVVMETSSNWKSELSLSSS